MLLQFTCSNHKSIKEPIQFSMMSSDKNVLQSTIIYGPNGSGKSNFINALAFMKTLVCNSIYFQPNELLPQYHHKSNTQDILSEYQIQFMKNGIRYAYGFSIKHHVIEEEYLYCFPNGNQELIFKRNGLNIQADNRFSLSKQVLKKNRLFLSCAANYSNVQSAVDAFLFFADDLVVYNIENALDHSIEMMYKKPALKEKVIGVLQALGTGIQDVRVKIEDVSTLYQNKSKIMAKVMYDTFETDLLLEESTGIKQLFSVVCAMIDTMDTGKIMLVDDLDVHLHEIVVRQLIQSFHQQSNRFSQLIITTYDTSLLDNELFRKDQIWFTQLNEKRATDLYSLLEFKDVHSYENIHREYVSGRYGAIPLINQKFF